MYSRVRTADFERDDGYKRFGGGGVAGVTLVLSLVVVRSQQKRHLTRHNRSSHSTHRLQHWVSCTYTPHTSTCRPPGWSLESLLQDQHQNSGSRPTLWVSKHLKNKIQVWQTSSLLRTALRTPPMTLGDATHHINTQPSMKWNFYTASVT